MNSIPANLRGFVENVPDTPVVLLIEHLPEDRDAIRHAVQSHFNGGHVRTTCRMSEALADGLDDIDLIIASTELPDIQGSRVLEEVFLLRPDLPVILTASQSGPQLAVQAIREGAYDYLVKSPGYLDMIPLVIEKNMALHRVKQENARLQVQLTSTLAQLRAKNSQLQNLVKELETIAATDALTGIANRRAFSAALEQRFAYAVRNNTDLSLLSIDMDGFKALNDTAGHPAGDRLLMLAARVLRANCRASDVPGRIGGDEFVVLLPETDIEEARAVAQRIQDDYASASTGLCATLGYEGQLSMSLGLASRVGAGVTSAETLFGLADKAMYQAKARGKSRLVIHQG